MTKEELEKEADKYADTVKCEWENDTYWVDCSDKVTDAYLAGAEPREKRIAELEQKLEQIEKDLADYQFNYPTIKELEKENAELKETLKTYNGCGDWDNDFHTCRVYLQHEELQMYADQLTKAKELLKRLLTTPRSIYRRDEDGELTSFFNSDYEELEKLAEQFLSEVKK